MRERRISVVKVHPCWFDAAAASGESRSEVIERILRQSFSEQARRQQDLRDLDLINKNAAELNEEAEDVLSFQVEL